MTEMRKIGINFILVLLFVYAIVGLFFFLNLGLSAANMYLFLAFIGLVFILVTVVARFAFGKVFWFEVPISNNPERGVLMLFLGMVGLGLVLAISAFSGANFWSPFYMAPFAFETGGLTIGVETFSALKAATSDFGQVFVTVITASVIEEIVLGFAFVLMGSFIGFGLRNAFKLDLSDGGEAFWDFSVAMIFSVVLFSILHIFNHTYLNPDGTLNLALFGFAAAFRFVLNIFIYKFGNFGLLFAIGVHAVNNAAFLGADTIFAALKTFPGGVILDAIIVIIVFFGVTSLPKIYREGELVVRDFFTFD